MRVTPGRARPLGVRPDATGCNVAVHAPGDVWFCIFDDTDAEVARFRLPGRHGDVAHGHVAGLGIGARYGLRVAGDKRLLIDPYATRLDRVPRLDPRMFDADADSAPACPKGIVEAPFPNTPPLARGDAPRVILELHVRGFTMTHPGIPPGLRSTFAGLAHPAAIAHLVGLGITHVELLPCAAWIEERHLPPLGLTNYWGYNPIAFLAPDPRLAPGGMAEVRAAIAALHAAGIGVLLDVVFNHTGEGDAQGPTLSLRGLDAAGYYRLDSTGRLVDDAGCGNTLACDRPAVVRLVMDALRHWAGAGVDGFRFDLATTLGRGPDGFSPDAPLLTAMAQDPLLHDRLLIMEPWDIGFLGYQLGAFRAGQPEWNDRFRQDVRRFWRGDRGMLGALATRLSGSPDIFAGRHRPATDSLNFITAHDGFSLADLVAFTTKHNAANGESNRDGTDDNASWNGGAEGPTDDPAILARRRADARALLMTLLTARGTPMLSMGDEAGRSQGGNNNAYAQDNATSWFDWQGMDSDLVAFTARLVAARLAHPALHGAKWLTGVAQDVAWLRADGTAMAEADWDSRTLLVALFDAAADDRVLVAIQGTPTTTEATLPPPRPGRRWTLVADSSDPRRQGPVAGHRLALPPHSMLLLAETISDAPRPDDDALARLAAAAGISPEWWGFDGTRHAVPDDTARAILHAMRLPAGTAAEARDSLAHLAQDRDHRPLPASAVLRAGGHLALVVPEGRRDGITIQRADGGTEHHLLHPWELPAAERIAADGARIRLHLWPLPPLPAGRHVLRLDSAPDASCLLTLAPSRGFWPEALADGGRRFGIAAQLYTLRDGLDRGMGDLATLATMARATAATGAAVLGLNPLHMLFPQDRDRASPYHPSDRRFLDPMLIGLGPAHPGGALVDYPAVWQARRAALEAGFAPEDPGFAAFRTAGGAALEHFATFQAIAETALGADWRRWPAALRDRDPAGLAEFAAQHGSRVAFHAWLQFRADTDLGAAAASGLEIGLYRDLAVGCAPDGVEAWANQAGLLKGLSIGAPPDAFAANGQVWALPPPDPLAEAREGHASFAALLAANMRHAGALRIDHVLGLRRLFLMPDGARGQDGAYLDRPLDDLLGHVALESQAARCLVVGEDLGTVPDGMAEALAGAGVLSTRVLLFERDGATFRQPATLPANAAVHVMTHDLPTLVGWWQGADIAERKAIGLDASDDRAADKAALLVMLVEAGLWAGEADPAMTPALAAAIHAAIAGSDAALAFVQADDLVRETMAVNLPGTDRERPNWRRRLSVPVDGLATTPYGAAILAAMRKLRP
ncbi:glycogen debranching protein GlgX [Humitalea sp. 24SJ18S-53]|uniref:glycogen debranching protein GlgX n=1 Tax=Humitalea sp. 24SJ18S-53 TaxID=3422307 RepID=UPI003D673770